MINISDVKTKGIKGSIWNFFNLMVNQFRSFIVTLVLARLLVPADFGLVSMAMVLNSILDFLADFGFSSALIRKDKITDIETSTVFWINVIMGAICSLVVFLSAPLFALFYNMPQLKSIIYVTSTSFVISSLGTLQTALFQRELNFRKPFIARLISSISSGVLGIILAVCGAGVWALVFSNLTGWILYSILIWFMSSWRPKLIFQYKAVSDMVTFGWKMTLSTFINRIVRQLDTLIIGKLYSATSLGLYNRAQSLNNLVIDYSFSSIRSVMLPSLSKLQNDNEALQYSVLKLLHVISFLTFLVSGLMYICADDLIPLLYGEQWKGAISIFKILGLFSISICLPVVFDTVLTVANRMTLYLWLSILRNSLVLLAIPIGLYYGFMGYLWAISIAGIIKLVPSFIFARSSIGLSIKPQFISVVSYAFPFILLLIIGDFICINVHNYLFNIIIKGSYFLLFYIGINICLKNDGLKVCWNLLQHIVNKGKK